MIALSRLRIIISRHWEANYSLSFSCKGIAKKQSFKSITIRGYLLGKREGKEIPDCREPIGGITLLTAHGCVSILYFPDLILTANTEELQGLNAEHLAVPVPNVLKPAVSLLLKAIAQPMQFLCLSVNHFKGRAVGAFEG